MKFNLILSFILLAIIFQVNSYNLAPGTYQVDSEDPELSEMKTKMTFSQGAFTYIECNTYNCYFSQSGD